MIFIINSRLRQIRRQQIATCKEVILVDRLGDGVDVAGAADQRHHAIAFALALDGKGIRTTTGKNGALGLDLLFLAYLCPL